MEDNLKNEIVKNIFSKFLLINENIPRQKFMSLQDKSFLLYDKLSFETDEKQFNNNIYGCQFLISENPLKIILGDCSADSHEYCLIVNLKDSPVYGLYIDYDNNLSFIKYKFQDLEWLDCSTYLQATFLAAMEQIKDTNLSPSKCKEYEAELKLLKEIINEVNDEGQED